MTVRQTLIDTLSAALSPETLDVRDDSAKHEGHVGSRPEGETHFHLTMVSSKFTGLSRIDRQRAVHTALKEELKERVHALSMDLKAPNE